MGATRPSTGTELVNAALSAALAGPSYVSRMWVLYFVRVPHVGPVLRMCPVCGSLYMWPYVCACVSLSVSSACLVNFLWPCVCPCV